MHNKELHDHGELDDVDPDDDSRFDIIYRHLDPNLGIEKGNIDDGRDDIKISYHMEHFAPTQRSFDSSGN